MKDKIKDKNFIYDNAVRMGIKHYIKEMLYAVKSAGYRMQDTPKDKHSERKKYEVSICAIFKNEGRYLKEWLEFHKIVGVDHFFLYNNNSEDDYMRILKPYIEQGIVDLVQWEKNQAQMEAYEDCIKNYSELTDWIGFIDIDEFIVPIEDDSIKDFLYKFDNKGSVMIYWKMFGTSGKIGRNMTDLVTESFHVSWSKHVNIGKCFYNTKFGYAYGCNKNSTLHHCLWTKNRDKLIPPVNCFGKYVFMGMHKSGGRDFPIQINHYFTKSYNEYALKRAKGDVYFKINPHDEEYFYEHEMKCTSTDYSIYKYLIKLKLAMSKK